MRQLRALPDERSAQMLVDALDDSGIETDLKSGQDGAFAVWVLDETQLPRARELVAEWLERGDEQAYTRAAARGRGARELRQRTEQRRRQQAESAARDYETITRPPPTPLTWGLIALCVGIAVLTQLGQNQGVIRSLIIIDPRAIAVTTLSFLGQHITWLGLPWHEPWRLITPVLVHFGVLHILFNMLWLRDLGRIIEVRHGARYLLSFVLLSGVLSNVAQYQIAQNPMFGGMSGVVYGLLGLIWTRGRLDVRAGYGLSRFTVQSMLLWMAIGFITPRMAMANWCHLFGLLVGMAWGFASARHAVRP
jgi:membrane associated rhomboid family serine protease